MSYVLKIRFTSNNPTPSPSSQGTGSIIIIIIIANVLQEAAPLLVAVVCSLLHLGEQN